MSPTKLVKAQLRRTVFHSEAEKLPRASLREATRGNLCACRDYAVSDAVRRIYGYTRRDDVSVRCARTGSRGYSMQQACITPRESHTPRYSGIAARRRVAPD